MRKHLLRLRSRFVLFILAGVGLVAAVIGGIGYMETREELLNAAQARLMDLTQLKAATLNAYLSDVVGRTEGLAVTLTGGPTFDEPALKNLLATQVADTSRIFGAAIGYAPGAFDPERRRFAIYMHRTGKGLRYAHLDSPSYNYLSQDWYTVPARRKIPVWSEPYFDEGGGNVLMTTYSVPVFRDGELMCVVTSDIALTALKRELTMLPALHGSWSFIISGDGKFLAGPDDSWVLHQSLASLGKRLGHDGLADLERRMKRGGISVVPLIDWRSSRPSWLAYAPVPGVGWSIATVVSEREVFAPARNLAKKQALTMLGGLLFMVAIVWLLVTGLTLPLMRLAAAARRLAAGNFNTRVKKIRPGDELGEVAESFNRMVGDLNHYVEQLTQTTAAKERIESELDLARRIQESILPRTYPPYPDRPEFDLFGKAIPAKQVGGDFFDYFMLGNDLLALVIGDVSGKGVPSALFMTVARTVIRSSSDYLQDPVDVLEQANRQIMPGNDMCMFVTVFYGLYRISTGKLTYANAGHPAPLLRRADGTVQRLDQPGGMAVGVYEDLGLKSGSARLEPGETLLIFTDGLDEAINPAGEMFGVARAEQWLARAKDVKAPDMLDTLVAYHQEFTGPMDQFDDLTLLMLRRTL